MLHLVVDSVACLPRPGSYLGIAVVAVSGTDKYAVAVIIDLTWTGRSVAVGVEAVAGLLCTRIDRRIVGRAVLRVQPSVPV